MTAPRVNVAIVGAGAGGGIVAKQLSEAGLTVALLERGGWASFEQHDHDELTSQRTTVLGNAFGPDDERHLRLIPDDAGGWRPVRPSQSGYSNNAACVGSGTVSYGAMAWRFMPQDFRMRATYGAVDGSTLDDWPLSYDDLESCYERAEWDLGVAGDDRQNPFAPPRRKPQPMPPFAYNREGRLLADAAQRLGLHPFPIPMLRNSVAYDGRPACIGCRYCVGFACEVNAKNGTHNTVIPRTLATGNCQLYTESVVSRIEFDEHGRAAGVHYFDHQDHPQYQPSDLVVVAASATETARLLLNSHCKLFPHGAGNRHDWVGRNLQGHAYPGCFGLFEDEVYDDIGAGATVAICDFSHGNPGLTGGAMLANEFIRLPYLFADRRPPGAASWGREHKEFQRRFFRRSISVKGPVQEMPVFASRVEVDPSVTDHWGIPVARISGYRHPHDLEISQFVAEKAQQWLREAGAFETWISLPGRGVSGGQHQAGTCRMGNDPQTSVTNRYGQLHDVDNLFVADGSLHVTNGGFNPVLTIMALGYWVSDYICREWQTGGLRSG